MGMTPSALRAKLRDLLEELADGTVTGVHGGVPISGIMFEYPLDQVVDDLAAGIERLDDDDEKTEEKNDDRE